MARIKIEDLPVLEDLSEKQMKGLFGGEWESSWNPFYHIGYGLNRLLDDSPEGGFDPLNKDHRNAYPNYESRRTTDLGGMAGRIGSPDE